MSKDLSPILRGWDYNPNRVSARWITGNDGSPKIQLRLDLGLFQMEMEGRPDGTTPHGYPSLLDYYLALEKTGKPDHPALKLGEAACAELQQEAVQYYYRYLAFYALKHLDGVVQDTDHNLALFAFVSRHALDDDLAWQFLQFFPYVRMMNARALADVAVEQKKYEDAIICVQHALDDIHHFWKDHGQEGEIEASDEIEILTEVLNSLQRRRPRSRKDILKEDLEQAIATEDYEKAAALRDALRTLTGKEPVEGEVL